jgi:hypothetical protein
MIVYQSNIISRKRKYPMSRYWVTGFTRNMTRYGCQSKTLRKSVKKWDFLSCFSSLIVSPNFASKDGEMKRSYRPRTLHEFTRNQYRMKVISLIISIYLVGTLIILPAVKSLGFAYVTFNKFVHVNKTIPDLIHKADI